MMIWLEFFDQMSGSCIAYSEWLFLLGGQGSRNSVVCLKLQTRK